MRFAFVLVVACSLAGLALAGEVPLLTGCAITSNGSVGSSGTDADCVWVSGDWLKLQCDQPVYYRSDGTDPTSTSPKVNFPGDPYPIRAFDSSTAKPLKVLNVSAAATCAVFKDDGRL
jgi:hypothetical protein